MTMPTTDNMDALIRWYVTSRSFALERFANSASHYLTTEYELATGSGDVCYSFSESYWRHPSKLGWTRVMSLDGRYEGAIDDQWCRCGPDSSPDFMYSYCRRCLGRTSEDSPTKELP